MTSPTAKTLNLLRRAGYMTAVVEKWIPRLERRSDLWRFGDVLAVHVQRREFLIVQATSLGNLASRLAKAKQQPELEQWLLAGGRFEVHGWADRGVKRVEVQAEDLTPIVLTMPRRKTRGADRWQPGKLFA